MTPRCGRPVDRANPTTRDWTNPVNASATNRQPEPMADKGQSALPPIAGRARRIEDLPKEVGVMLVSVGVLGFVLPAVAGTPAIVAGGLVSGRARSGNSSGGSNAATPGCIMRGCGRSAATSTTLRCASPTQPDDNPPDRRRDRRNPAAGPRRDALPGAGERGPLAKDVPVPEGVLERRFPRLHHQGTPQGFNSQSLSFCRAVQKLPRW